MSNTKDMNYVFAKSITADKSLLSDTNITDLTKSNLKLTMPSNSYIHPRVTASSNAIWAVSFRFFLETGDFEVISVTYTLPSALTVVRSRHLSRWWCCNSKISSSRPASSSSTPDSWAASLASAAFFLETKAAPEDALAIRIRAKRAFWNWEC